MSRKRYVMSDDNYNDHDYQRKDGYVGTPHSRSSRPPRSAVHIQRPDGNPARPVNPPPRTSVTEQSQHPNSRP